MLKDHSTVGSNLYLGTTLVSSRKKKKRSVSPLKTFLPFLEIYLSADYSFYRRV